MNNEVRNQVVVVDVRMPFWSMVRFMVKWSIAAIPAIVILIVIGTIVSALLSTLIGSHGGRWI